MKLATNLFTQALGAGRKQVGLWLSLCSNVVAEAIAPAGYDWVAIDMEHAPNDQASVLSQLQVFAATDTTALVRPQWNDPVLVKQLLDLGAPGLIFPMIQTVAEATRAVASTRYPPRGIRGVAGSTRANRFGRISDYFERVEDQTTVIVQLETRAALERAEAIAAVDGVTGVFFGPADIAADLGLIGQPGAAAVWELIMPVAKKLIAKGVPVGTLVLDPPFAQKLLHEGFTFVACGADSALLARGADQLLASVKADL